MGASDVTAANYPTLRRFQPFGAGGICWLRRCELSERPARPAAAVDALCNVESLLASGFSERSMPIYHQLLVFEAYEQGLLATWETSDAMVCSLRIGPA
jgi:hypothetical protein